MAAPAPTKEIVPKKPLSPFMGWLLEGYIQRTGPHVKTEVEHKAHPWWKVMCLTGVDYFSTLGYQPGIAALAAGALSPIATLILVLLTLFGAYPIYRQVARESPHGEGSISMLEHLLEWWKGKLFVLVLLGFVATDFIITITLSAADATAHLIENPLAPHFFEGKQIVVTLVFVALLGGVFLKGFKEAIGIAVGLVAVYLALNVVVVGVGVYQVATHPQTLGDWRAALFQSHGSPLAMVGAALLLFPKLALGLSGFETGVAVMPLVKGKDGDTEDAPAGRITNTHHLLLTSALIMSVFLIASSVITTLLIPAHEFAAGDAAKNIAKGAANGRALAFLAHKYLGDAFGTAYDLSTIGILWFAGASAMAGLLNIVPRYLPRYGMAPEWTRAARPLSLIYLVIAFAVTLYFKADVDAQGGAYATGVLVLMTSAAVAVTISAWHRSKKAAAGFGLIALVFAYTTVVNMIERPDGLKIASFFIFTIVTVSFMSRIWRTLELRVTRVELDETAQRFVDEAAQRDEIRVITNEPDKQGPREYAREEQEARDDHRLPADAPLLILEVTVRDSSEFSDALRIKGVEIEGHRVLRAEATAVPNAIAAFLLYLRDETGKETHAYFNWSEGNPALYLIRYILSGKGDVAPVTREILRQAEPDPAKRPGIHAAM